MASFVAMGRQHLRLVDLRGGGTAQMEWLLNESQ
jgi:hypothetical protein